MPALTEQEGASMRLSGQIDALQESFRLLASAGSLKELSSRCAGVLGRAFPSSAAEILFRRQDAPTWQVLSGGSGERPLDAVTLPEAERALDGALLKGGTELRVVVRLADRSSLALKVCTGADELTFKEPDLVTLRLLAHLFDTGYQALLSRRTEKDLIFSLNHRVLQLTSLIDTGIEVTKLDQGLPPHHLALQRAASLTNASKGVVTVVRAEGSTEVYAFPAAAPQGDSPATGSQITSGFSFGGGTYTFELFEKESRTGIIAFDETDQLLLDALARQVHASLENRYLHAQALEKQRLEQDIAVAAAIQQRILPAKLAAIAGFDIAGINIPSKSVGGDYYDCIALPDGRFALVVADVAGKGIPAALLVSSFHAFLSAYLEGGMSLLEIARNLNRAICRASTDDKFITAFLAILEPATGDLVSLNAGHTPAYLLRGNSTIQELNAGGVPFGMLDMDFPFQSEQIRIGAGERLLIYTDGVTEAANEQYALYDTVHPLRDFVSSHMPDEASLFIRELITDIKAFTGKADQNDDITALYLVRR